MAMANITRMHCHRMDTYPSFTDIFVQCPDYAYIVLTAVNTLLCVAQLVIFFHLMWCRGCERRKEVPYLVSLAPICSVISVIELYNLATVTLLSAFRFVYLVFCILQFYQYCIGYYGDWLDVNRMLIGFRFDIQRGCYSCKRTKEITITRARLICNKSVVYTGVITYIIMNMITVVFPDLGETAEDVILAVGVVLYIWGIQCIKRFLLITQAFYPESAMKLKKRFMAVRICFVVIGLQGFMLRLLEVMGCVPPVGLFSSKVMVDVIHNLLVPGELLFAVYLAHRAFVLEKVELESAPLLVKDSTYRNSQSCQTDDEDSNHSNHGADSGVHSPDLPEGEPSYIHGYGSLNSDMMSHVDNAIRNSLRRSNPDLYQYNSHLKTMII